MEASVRAYLDCEGFTKHPEQIRGQRRQTAVSEQMSQELRANTSLHLERSTLTAPQHFTAVCHPVSWVLV